MRCLASCNMTDFYKIKCAFIDKKDITLRGNRRGSAVVLACITLDFLGLIITFHTFDTFGYYQLCFKYKACTLLTL